MQTIVCTTISAGTGGRAFTFYTLLVTQLELYSELVVTNIYLVSGRNIFFRLATTVILLL
jgi:hypothetical protein